MKSAGKWPMTLDVSIPGPHPSLLTNSHLVGVDKETFHLFETPPGISEDFRPVILRPPWKMLFMTNPGMELPILPLFRQQRATRASSPPRPDPTSELRIMFEPTMQYLQNGATGLHLETAGPSTEPPANADLGSGASTAEPGSTAV